MKDEDDNVDDDVPDGDDADYDWTEVPTPRTRASMLASRRRIEDLMELRRMRALLEDDDFELDFN